MQNDTRATLFIVEDDLAFAEMITDHLNTRFPNFKIVKYTNGDDSLTDLKSLKPEFVLLDYYLDKKDIYALNGIDVLAHMRKDRPETKVIIISAQEHIEVAVNMMKYGAYDYIVKNEAAHLRLENDLNHLTDQLEVDRQVRLNKLLMTVVGIITLLVILSIVLFIK